MSTDQIYLIICGVCGVIFHSLIKMDQLSVTSRKANIPFHWIRDYVIPDFFSILSSFLSVAVWYLIFGEVATKFQWLYIFPRVSFFTMGGIGSYGLQLWLGRAKRRILKIIDLKTDIADRKIKAA